MPDYKTSTNSAEPGIHPSVNSTVLSYILISAILLTSILSSLYYLQFKNQFDSNRVDSQAQDEQLLSLHIQQSDQQLTQLLSTISSLKNLNQIVQLKDSSGLHEKFDNHWLELQKSHGLNFAGFFDLEAQPLALYPPDNIEKGFRQQLEQWISSAKSDTPLSLLNCDNICSRYLISPLFFDNSKTGYLIIAVPMSLTLDQFNSKINRVAGFLTPAQNRDTSTDILVFKWGYSVRGLTDSNINKPVIQEFAKKFPELIGNKSLVNSTINQHFYQLAVYPLTPSGDDQLIVLDDITENIHQILLSTFWFALTTLIVTVVFQLLVFLLLKRSFAGSQSLLDKATAEADHSEPDKPAALILEVQPLTPAEELEFPTSDNDILSDDKLELLKQYNEDINLSLTRQMINLSRERDMVNSILDNSQTIIMRLLADGTIDSINRFGEISSGYSNDELQGKKFTDLYPDNSNLAQQDLDTLADISNQHEQIFQHEAKLKRKDGKESIILWFHTKLETEDNIEPAILSTGLDITQHKTLESKLSWLVNHDNLTSLFNRRRFENELDSALTWAKKVQADGILLTIDLGNFKQINESCGHKVGDIILRKVATTLLELTRQLDSSTNTVTARLGGDVFAIILPGYNGQTATLLSEKIITALNSITHFQRQVSYQLTSSIGIASFSVAGNNATELLSNANYARNEAKIEGRNRYYLFQTEHSDLAQTHHHKVWRERIENAIRNEQFILHFQPILNIDQGKISHYETLIRMVDDNQQLVSPNLFIHIAEQFEMVQHIDNYIITAAIAKQGELVKQGNDITLTINLSAKAFDDPELYNKINQAISENNANPEHLVFEINETSTVANIINSEKMMTKIQSLGCQFALDDFGNGFSSFHYLRKLPIEYVKIDGSFITDLANNSDNNVLVQALSEIAIGFNKQTIAEHVDSMQTLDLLRQAKINYAQGYFIGEPGESIPVDMPEFCYSIDKK